MSSTEDRMKALAEKHFGMDVDIDVSLRDTEISSLDQLAFLKRVAEEFQTAISSLDAEQFENLRALAKYIDDRS